MDYIIIVAVIVIAILYIKLYRKHVKVKREYDIYHKKSQQYQTNLCKMLESRGVDPSLISIEASNVLIFEAVIDDADITSLCIMNFKKEIIFEYKANSDPRSLSDYRDLIRSKLSDHKLAGYSTNEALNVMEKLGYFSHIKDNWMLLPLDLAFHFARINGELRFEENIYTGDTWRNNYPLTKICDYYGYEHYVDMDDATDICKASSYCLNKIAALDGNVIRIEFE